MFQRLEPWKIIDSTGSGQEQSAIRNEASCSIETDESETWFTLFEPRPGRLSSDSEGIPGSSLEAIAVAAGLFSNDLGARRTQKRAFQRAQRVAWIGACARDEIARADVRMRDGFQDAQTGSPQTIADGGLDETRPSPRFDALVAQQLDRPDCDSAFAVCNWAPRRGSQKYGPEVELSASSPASPGGWAVQREALQREALQHDLNLNQARWPSQPGEFEAVRLSGRHALWRSMLPCARLFPARGGEDEGAVSGRGSPEAPGEHHPLHSAPSIDALSTAAMPSDAGQRLSPRAGSLWAIRCVSGP
ncbi:uncharacterized protein BDZ99DRAFT_513818 [Mytilinidion resinicola]|uniref:Uncharacterized protein n=1 Tax=Mytilinidion resinicola TaxID=574789 RepID=A0A6A6ZBA0_9PEZI|nr:uncharacterized protein BDZ99DRAFT_513818 [Mytilinidion resinicola]KAF2817584.1 hypothetical protein BDZ99DRAFT_513818 [Mytilinidion resinicola]